MHALQANSTTIRKSFTNRLLIENDHHVFSGAMVNDTALHQARQRTTVLLRSQRPKMSLRSRSRELHRRTAGCMAPYARESRAARLRTERLDPGHVSIKQPTETNIRFSNQTIIVHDNMLPETCIFTIIHFKEAIRK